MPQSRHGPLDAMNRMYWNMSRVSAIRMNPPHKPTCHYPPRCIARSIKLTAATNVNPTPARSSTVKRPGMGDCSDVPPVWWTWYTGFGHAPEMKETAEMPRAYAPELRRRVMDLIESGRSVAEVAAMVEPTEQTIYNWWNRHLVDTGRRAEHRRSRTANCSRRAAGSRSSRRSWRRLAEPTSC